MTKLTLIGFGAIGQNVCERSILRGLANEIVCIDLREKQSQGSLDDILQSTPADMKDVSAMVTTNYEAARNSDVIVITAGTTGIPKDGGVFNRDVMLSSNTKIIASIAKEVKKVAPKAFVIVVTNPMDTIVEVFSRISGIPHNRVVGEAGTDDNRLRYFVAKELGVSVRDVDGYVVGPHGNKMVLAFSTVKVKGMPVTLTEEQMTRIRHNVVMGAADVIAKNGISPFRTVATAITDTIDAYVNNRRRVLGVSTFDEKKGFYYSWPSIIDGTGVVERYSNPKAILSDVEFSELESALTVLDSDNKMADSILSDM